jgi:hypothetical protein
MRFVRSITKSQARLPYSVEHESVSPIEGEFSVRWAVSIVESPPMGLEQQVLRENRAAPVGEDPRR